MRAIATLLVLLGVLAAVPSRARAQDAEREELIRRRDATLAEPWVTRVPWERSLADAKAAANANDALIFAYFTRSHAPSAACAFVESGAFSDEAFLEFAREYVLLLNLTTHVKGDPDQRLLHAAGGFEVPFVVFMDTDGIVLAHHRGPNTVEAFARTRATAVAAYRELERAASAEGATTDARLSFLLERIELHHFDSVAAKAEAAKFEDLTELQQAQYDQAVVMLEIFDRLDATTSAVESQRAAGKAFKEMADVGRTPRTSDARSFRNFWMLQLTWAKNAKDAEVYERAYDAMFAQFGENPRAARFFAQRKAVLDELKAQAENDSDGDGEGEGDDGADRDDGTDRDDGMDG